MISFIGADGYLHQYYDWVDRDCTRSPDEYPYSFDAYYVWRDFEDDDKPEGLSSYHHDRIWQQMPDLFSQAAPKKKSIMQFSKNDCCEFVDIVFGGRQKCVGFAICCNVSNGYQIGIFFTIPT